MKRYLQISFRFIQPYPLFHGRGDGDEPEWPPSPLRAFQAVLSAACLRTPGEALRPEVLVALKVIEKSLPTITAPRATLSGLGRRSYVPHNQGDLVAFAWERGNSGANMASHRVEKDHRPYCIEAEGEGLPAIHYVYPLDASAQPDDLLRAIRPVVRSIHCLGWGIDQVIADATLVESAYSHVSSAHWEPTPRGGRRLRVPRNGSLDELSARHHKFLNRVVGDEWTPVPSLAVLDRVRYRRNGDPVARPNAVFKLVDATDQTVTYPQAKLVHVAGMVRHIAIAKMKQNPPRDLRERQADEWVESYVAGHQAKEGRDVGVPHTQVSYMPLQSIGNPNADPGVRRVMIVCPIGDDAWLDHLVRHLDGAELEPLPGTNLPPGTRLELIDDQWADGVRDAYTRASAAWASVTPVILPGHDDHKPGKTRALLQKALRQSGIEQPCEFEWSAFSHFRKMLPAHKYRRDPDEPSKKILINYVRPDHLLNRSAVHVTLRFGDGLEVPGPITIGAGRHCGFGLMAAVSS